MKALQQNNAFRRMLSDFCKKRISGVLPPQETARLKTYMLDLMERSEPPPMNGAAIDLEMIAFCSGVAIEDLTNAGTVIHYGFDALRRELKRQPQVERKLSSKDSVQSKNQSESRGGQPVTNVPSQYREFLFAPPKVRRRAPVNKVAQQSRPIIEFPEAKFSDWTDPETFDEALRLHMKRHGDKFLCELLDRCFGN